MKDGWFDSDETKKREKIKRLYTVAGAAHVCKLHCVSRLTADMTMSAGTKTAAF